MTGARSRIRDSCSVASSTGSAFTKAGTYSFLSLIHAGMAGTVHVQDAGTRYPASQATWDTERSGSQRTGSRRPVGASGTHARRRSQLGDRGRRHRPPDPGRAGSVAVMRFLPSRIVVHAGQSVTWVNQDPETPAYRDVRHEPGGGPLGSSSRPGSTARGTPRAASTTQSVNSGSQARRSSERRSRRRSPRRARITTSARCTMTWA